MYRQSATYSCSQDFFFFLLYHGVEAQLQAVSVLSTFKVGKAKLNYDIWKTKCIKCILTSNSFNL